jgi:hypothetical protein
MVATAAVNRAACTYGSQVLIIGPNIGIRSPRCPFPEITQKENGSPGEKIALEEKNSPAAPGRPGLKILLEEKNLRIRPQAVVAPCPRWKTDPPTTLQN